MTTNSHEDGFSSDEPVKPTATSKKINLERHHSSDQKGKKTPKNHRVESIYVVKPKSVSSHKNSETIWASCRFWASPRQETQFKDQPSPLASRQLATSNNTRMLLFREKAIGIRWIDSLLCVPVWLSCCRVVVLLCCCVVVLSNRSHIALWFSAAGVSVSRRRRCG